MGGVQLERFVPLDWTPRTRFTAYVVMKTSRFGLPAGSMTAPDVALPFKADATVAGLAVGLAAR